MKVPYSWIKELVNIDETPQQLAEKLLNSGFEVESIDFLGKDIFNVRIGKIVDLQRHPNADKLQVCVLDFGEYKKTILTAATNVFLGCVVPAALDGAFLPTGHAIKTTVMRGVESEGMLCSGSELMIDNSVIDGAEVDGILLLPPNAKLGADIIDYLGLNDYILDISITSNRPDCNSILGIAREISVLTGKPLKLPNLKYKTIEGSASDFVKVNVHAPALCPNYNLAVVKDIKLEKSPAWMRDRLRKVGIRSINNYVDITNYVLTEIGSPMHAFDMDLIGGGEINVRTAKKDEKLLALDGKNYALNTNTLLICDKEKAIGIAGVMGGENESINPQTENVAFEAAKFTRGNIRQTSRALGLRSESSAKFEKGVDISNVEMGLSRALALVYELNCGTIIKGISKTPADIPAKRIINVTVNKINGILGIEVPAKTIISILKKLDIAVVEQNGVLKCEIPLYREDLENDADIAEEIIRIYGYDKIVPTLPATYTEQGKSAAITISDKAKRTLAGLGCFEAVTYSFVNKTCFDKLMLPDCDLRRNAVALRNPISEDFGIMRTNLIHNMLTALSLNQNRKNSDVRLFEISHVYLPESQPQRESKNGICLPIEAQVLSIGVYGQSESFYTLKGIIEEVFRDYGLTNLEYNECVQSYLHDGIAADIVYDGKVYGHFGQTHPKIEENYELAEKCFVAEIDFDLLTKHSHIIKFEQLPKFQEMERDIALTVKDEIKAADIKKFLIENAGELAESVTMFDVYKGAQIEKGYKSVAYKIIFRSKTRTLVDSEVSEIMTRLHSLADKRYGAKIRGL